MEQSRAVVGVEWSEVGQWWDRSTNGGVKSLLSLCFGLSLRNQFPTGVFVDA